MKDTNESPHAGLARQPWNKGKLTGTRPPLQPRHVWAVRTGMMLEGRNRDLALFNLAIDGKLRGCGVVAVRVEDVAPRVAPSTGRQSSSERQAIWFESRREGQPLTTWQYARLLSQWIASIGFDPSLYGTHSLRRTKATMIYKRAGILRPRSAPPRPHQDREHRTLPRHQS